MIYSEYETGQEAREIVDTRNQGANALYSLFEEQFRTSEIVAQAWRKFLVGKPKEASYEKSVTWLMNRYHVSICDARVGLYFGEGIKDADIDGCSLYKEYDYNMIAAILCTHGFYFSYTPKGTRTKRVTVGPNGTHKNITERTILIRGEMEGLIPYQTVLATPQNIRINLEDLIISPLTRITNRTPYEEV